MLVLLVRIRMRGSRLWLERSNEKEIGRDRKKNRDRDRLIDNKINKEIGINKDKKIEIKMLH